MQKIILSVILFLFSLSLVSGQNEPGKYFPETTTISSGDRLSVGNNFPVVRASQISISGRVFDKLRMNPLEGIDITLQGITNSSYNSSTQTDSQGYYSFTDLTESYIYEIRIQDLANYDNLKLRARAPQLVNCFLMLKNPAPPKTVVAFPGIISNLLKWTHSNSDDVKGYFVQRTALSGEPVNLNAQPVFNNYFQDTSALEGQQYKYEILSVDYDDNLSSPSESTNYVSSGGIELFIGNINTKPLSEFIVPVIIKNPLGLTSSLMELYISYDADYLSFVKLEPCYMTENVIFNTTYCNIENCISPPLGQLVIKNLNSTSPPLFGSGALVFMRFAARPALISGKQAEIKFLNILSPATDPVKMYKPSSFTNPVTIRSLHNGIVKAERNSIPGDIDLNGQINLFDAYLATQYLSGAKHAPPDILERADLDNNGIFNSLDISLIISRVMGTKSPDSKEKFETPKAAAATYNLSISSGTVEQGETNNTILSIDTGDGIISGDFTISYSSENLFLESVTPMGALAGSVWSYNNYDGKVKIAFSLITPMSSDPQQLFNLVFKANNTSEEGYSDIVISDYTLSFQDGGDVSIEKDVRKTDGRFDIIVNANLPLEIIGENISSIRKSSGGKFNSKEKPAKLSYYILTPLQNTGTPLYIYEKHQVEFPGYVEATTETEKITVKIQKLSLAEKALLNADMNSCFAVYFSDNTFSDPVNVTIEYLDSDLLMRDGQPSTQYGMALYMQDSSTYQYNMPDGIQQKNLPDKTITMDNIIPDIKGSRVYFAAQGDPNSQVTAIENSWNLYE